MKEIYKKPVLDFLMFDSIDVITTSIGEFEEEEPGDLNSDEELE